MVMWTILTWVVTPICMYFFGFNGVALAAFLISFTSILPIYLVRKIVPIRIWESVWRQLLAALVMAGISVFGLPLWSKNFEWMLMGMALAGLSYAATLLLVGHEKVFAEVRSLRSK